MADSLRQSFGLEAQLAQHLVGMLPQQRWEDWRQINDRIALETATLTATDFVSEVPEPKESEVLAFYEKYKDNVPWMQHLVLGARLPAPDPGFKQPRRVKLNYVMGDVFAWRDKYRDSVTTEEIADYYQRNKRTQFVKSGSSGSASFDDKLFDKPAGDEQPAEDSGESESDSDSEKAPEENGESKPAEEDSSSVAPGKAFQLTAFQADAEKDSDSAESDKNEPEGDAPSDDSEKSAETSADEPASTDTKEEDADGKETSEKDTEVEYDSLEDVRDSIRDKLATDKAVVELKSIIERLYGELQTEYNPYGFQVISARADKTEIPTPPANLINLKDRAAAVGLTSEETVLLTQQALSETFVGKALDVQTKQEYVLQAVFSSLELYQPLLAQDLDGNWYLVTKVEDVPERIPSLEDIRDEVISAWKKQEASKLALKKGEELASECQKIGDTLANFLIGKPYEVLTTDLFSYLSYGTTPVEMQSGPKLGDAPPLEAIGPEFMAKAFDLGEKNVAAVPSYDQTKVYVIRLDHRERTQDGLRELFLKEANTWYGGQVMSMIRAQNQQRAVFGQVAERVGLDLENLNQNLQPNEDEEE